VTAPVTALGYPAAVTAMDPAAPYLIDYVETAPAAVSG